MIAPADARMAAARGVSVIATAWIAVQPRVARGDTAQIRRTTAVERANLQVLRDAGVRIAVGSDGFTTAPVEAAFLFSLGVFSAADVLHLWTTTTPQLVFPVRRIGRLRDGYEASLLALTCNPLEDFACIRQIGLQVKQGVLLMPPR